MRCAWTAAAAACGLLVTGACGYSDPTSQAGPTAGVQSGAPSAPAGGDDFNAGAGQAPTRFPDGLQLVDVKRGTGQRVNKGDQLSVHYTGWLSDGKKFDSSRDRGQPFDVTIGQGQVIPGWDEGVPGMSVGGVRKLIIPPALGYGAQGQPPTSPANSTLVFLIEVVGDKGAAPSPSPSASP